MADISKKDVVAVFDFRRYERDTAAFAQAAHHAGAGVVLFTDRWLSPIADIADALLPAQVASSSPFENMTPTVAVVETLVTAIAEDLGDKARERFEQFGRIADRWIRPWPAAEAAAETAESRTTADVPDPRQPEANPADIRPAS